MDTSKYRVLIVEDEECISDIAECALDREDIEIATAAEGEIVSYFVNDFDPHLIILGMRLGNLSGTEILKSVRTFNKTARVMFLSENRVTEPEMKEIKKLDISAFMVWPININEMADMAFKILEGKEFDDDISLISSIKNEPEDILINKGRKIIRSLANTHAQMRMQCEDFLREMENAPTAIENPQEALEKAARICRFVIDKLDAELSVIEEIRKLH